MMPRHYGWDQLLNVMHVQACLKILTRSSFVSFSSEILHLFLVWVELALLTIQDDLLIIKKAFWQNREKYLSIYLLACL